MVEKNNEGQSNKVQVVSEGKPAQTLAAKSNNTENNKLAATKEQDKKVNIGELRGNSGLTVINQMLNNGILTVGEKSALTDRAGVIASEIGQSSNGDESDGNIDRKKGKKTPKRNDKKVFEEGDIIQMMYKEWLLAGANWLFNETCFFLKKRAYGAGNLISDLMTKKDKSVTDAQGKVLETPKFAHGVSKAADKDWNKGMEGIDNFSYLTDAADKIRAGKVGDIENMPKELKEAISKMSPEQIQERFNPERVKKEQDNFKSVLKATHQFGNMYAYSKLIEEKMKNPDAFKGEDAEVLFKNAKADGQKLFAEYLDSQATLGKSPAEASKYAIETMENANKGTEKGVTTKYYKEAGYDYKPNKVFDGLVQHMEETKQQANSAEKPQTMYKEALINNNTSALFAVEKNSIDRTEGQLNGEKTAYEQRRDSSRNKINELRAKKGLGPSPTLAHTGGENTSGVVKADRKAEQTIARNNGGR